MQWPGLLLPVGGPLLLCGPDLAWRGGAERAFPLGPDVAAYRARVPRELSTHAPLFLLVGCRRGGVGSCLARRVAGPRRASA